MGNGKIKADIEMKYTLSLFLIIALYLTACALSPQTVIINPDLQVAKNAAATKAITLSLDITDIRSSNIIGQRGGVYESTSHITTGENTTSNLQKTLARAFTDVGYIVTGKGESADAKLIIEISDIKYFAHSEKVIQSIETKVVIRAICWKNNQEYTGTYSATRKKDVLTTPTVAENERLVNEALGVVLQRVLEDEELFLFIDG